MRIPEIPDIFADPFFGHPCAGEEATEPNETMGRRKLERKCGRLSDRLERRVTYAASRVAT